ncbi:MAG: hypothetical protein RIF46_08855 [Cyclobacteriaceae bacterium]
MKSFKILLLASLLVSIVALPNCGPNDPDGKDKTDTAKGQAELLVQSWTLQPNKAESDESGIVTDWNGLTLTFTGDKTGGTFSTNVSSLSGDAISEEVWPESDNWSFLVINNKTIIGTIVRDSDEIEMTVSVTTTSLIVTFTVGASGNRLSSVNGDWSFVFDRSN